MLYINNLTVPLLSIMCYVLCVMCSVLFACWQTLTSLLYVHNMYVYALNKKPARVCSAYSVSE